MQHLKEDEQQQVYLCDEESVSLKNVFIHDRHNWESLKRLGYIFEQQNKKLLAFMCFVESLRLNPCQPLVLVKTELLREHARLPVLESFVESSCTVSVIMAAHSRTEELRVSIQSVLNQTFKDFELIVINDGGKDEIKHIVDSFHSEQVKYFKLPQNRGHAAALNEGISRAQGKYIAYLDDDDIFYPNHLEVLVEATRKKAGIDFVYSNAWWCYGKIKSGMFVEEKRTLLNKRPPKFFNSRVFLKGNYISTLNILHKKEYLFKSGLFNPDLTHLFDWDLWIRFLPDAKFYQINQITGEYRWKKDNMSIVNNLDMAFLNPLLTAFYEYKQGKLALVKAYVEAGRTDDAVYILDELLSEYKFNHNSYSYTIDLFSISRKLECRPAKFFSYLMLLSEYCYYNFKASLKEAYQDKSLAMLLMLILASSIKGFRLLIKKTNNLFSRNKKGKNE